MANRPGDAKPAAGRPVVRWTIPRRIHTAVTATAVLVAVLGLVIGMAVSGLHGGLRQIGHTAGPQVVAASDLYFALNDMDAQVANVLLIGDERGLGVGRSAALTIYEQRRMRADEDVRQASAIADAGASGRQALRAVLDGLGRYEALAAEAILLDGQAHHAAGKAPPNVVAKYRQATDLLRTRVLPAANSLATSNAATSTTPTRRGVPVPATPRSGPGLSAPYCSPCSSACSGSSPGDSAGCSTPRSSSRRSSWRC